MLQKEMTMLNVPLDCLQGATLTGVRLPRAVKTAGHAKLGCVCDCDGNILPFGFVVRVISRASF